MNGSTPPHRPGPNHRIRHGRSGRHQPGTRRKACGFDELHADAAIGDLRRSSDLERAPASPRSSPIGRRVLARTRLPPQSRRPIFVDLKNLDPGAGHARTATLEGGRFATENFRRALLLRQCRPCRCCVLHAVQQEGDAPRLSKGYDDEIRFVRRCAQAQPPRQASSMFWAASGMPA